MMAESNERVGGGTPAASDARTGAGREADAAVRSRGGAAAAGPGGAAAESLRTPGDLRRPDAAPLEEEVRLRAYELYQARGGAGGHEVDDWVRAERDVRARMVGDRADGDAAGKRRAPDERAD